MKGKKTGGRTEGTPNKANADLATIINGVISPTRRAQLAAELAEGVTLQETERNGETRIYTKPPDIAAIRYLEEYATGKPRQIVEGPGDKGQFIHEVRFTIVQPVSGNGNGHS